MFSLNHFIWLGICAVLIFGFLYLISKKEPKLKEVLNVACAVCVLSELTKIFSVIRMVPLTDGSGYFPYLELNHLPLHLCSIMIIFIFFVRFSNNEKMNHLLYSLMYPAGIIGAAAALLMPSIFSTTITPAQAFSHPMAYQFFLYHTMLIILGVYIARSKEIQLTKKDFKTALILLFVFGVLSIYVNSMAATPVYENGVLVGLEHTSNFFFTYNPPIPIKLKTVGQWMLYLLVIGVLAVVLIYLLYLPIFKKEKAK